MKKVLKIFIFFAIIMSVFCIKEVEAGYAQDYYNEYRGEITEYGDILFKVVYYQDDGTPVTTIHNRYLSRTTIKVQPKINLPDRWWNNGEVPVFHGWPQHNKGLHVGTNNYDDSKVARNDQKIGIFMLTKTWGEECFESIPPYKEEGYATYGLHRYVNSYHAGQGAINVDFFYDDEYAAMYCEYWVGEKGKTCPDGHVPKGNSAFKCLVFTAILPTMTYKDTYAYTDAESLKIINEQQEEWRRILLTHEWTVVDFHIATYKIDPPIKISEQVFNWNIKSELQHKIVQIGSEDIAIVARQGDDINLDESYVINPKVTEGGVDGKTTTFDCRSTRNFKKGKPIYIMIYAEKAGMVGSDGTHPPTYIEWKPISRRKRIHCSIELLI